MKNICGHSHGASIQLGKLYRPRFLKSNQIIIFLTQTEKVYNKYTKVAVKLCTGVHVEKSLNNKNIKICSAIKVYN